MLNSNSYKKLYNKLEFRSKNYKVDADGEFSQTILYNMLILAEKNKGQHIIKNNKLILNEDNYIK
jgi:hypothetical protein